MSTIIHHGFRFRSGALQDVPGVLDELRPRLQRAARRRLVRWLATEACQIEHRLQS